MKQLNQFYDKKAMKITKKEQQISNQIERVLNPKEVKKEKQSTLKQMSQNSEMMSECGKYKSYINKTGNHYFTDDKVSEFLTSEKNTVYKTVADFQKLIDKLTQFGDGNSVEYKINPTPKYMQIKCSNCSTFSFWYKN